MNYADIRREMMATADPQLTPEQWNSVINLASWKCFHGKVYTPYKTTYEYLKRHPEIPALVVTHLRLGNHIDTLPLPEPEPELFQKEGA